MWYLVCDPHLTTFANNLRHSSNYRIDVGVATIRCIDHKHGGDRVQPRMDERYAEQLWQTLDNSVDMLPHS